MTRRRFWAPLREAWDALPTLFEESASLLAVRLTLTGAGRNIPGQTTIRIEQL
jgi:hypothetical protein